MRKNIFLFIFFILNSLIFSLDNYFIDWINGKIYSSEVVDFKVDENYAYNMLTAKNETKEKAKLNFYKILDKINIDDTHTLLSYFDERADKNRELSTLIDSAQLYRVEYPAFNKIKISYFIPMYGDRSLMSIIISERGTFTEDLKSYMGYYYNTQYSGVIIDARGELPSFDGYKVKVKPTLFVVIRDSEGTVILNKDNIFPDVIREKGMVKYSYNIKENFVNIVGDNPLRIVAIGTGDQLGSHIVIGLDSARKMLASSVTKKALQNGKLVIVIDP